ncbi:TPA: hypothetical protein R1P52_001140 [Acinetobacter baumannii]|uniref:hypothetical protein n=1 Tax=Acinetobacter baumannii TaxID=470 RepID=UPI00112BF5DD|nr:hypothetical protein [Acinetobacter baumannii]MCM1637846.1 hypothetical protein [Acinetobacter baumannii]MDP7763501.1 hypothetical protein [Acinetobacter baumannii]MDV5201630.1 hypothetical protein [Acinetobacter baumannii]MDV5274470.1 hypothetical protein [Acinetobacter baumannii]QFV03048.1 hypothetical protein DLI69_07185 [Acinetobacter baumannii]
MTWILLNKRWTAIIILVVVVVIQTAITNRYAGQLKQAEHQCQSQIQDIERKQVKALAEAQNQINQVSADYEQFKSEQRTKVEYVEREVQKIVERPVYKSSCIDTDGMQQINDLIKAGNTS